MKVDGNFVLILLFLSFTSGCMKLTQLNPFIPNSSSYKSEERTIGAWLPVTTSNYDKIVNQISNTSSWGGLLNVVQVLGCGWRIVDDVITLNNSEWESKACQSVVNVIMDKDIDLHIWLGGVTNEIVKSPEKFIDSANKLLKTQPFIKGIHFDDETECAPRANIKNFTLWLDFMNLFSEEMHKEHVLVTAAVQALFGIEDVQYLHNYPCLKDPWKYKTNKTLVDVLQHMKVDRFLEMDTYYFTLSRFLNALDWYSKHIPLDKLGVTVANRDVNPLPNADEYLARVYAIDKSSANWWNFFDLPIDDEWLEWAWRWKTKCSGCPNMSCYDLSVSCNREF